jgi:hypothetical protein
MQISVKRINYSELLLDAWLSEGIDFSDFDKADVISIQSSAFEMNLKDNIL